MPSCFISVAASSVGALALSENSLYTVEAFRDFLEHLTPEGTLTVNRMAVQEHSAGPAGVSATSKPSAFPLTR